jgi:hypothetical protein
LPASPPDPNIKEQRGCFVKTTGDGLLLGSASIIDAGEYFADGMNL